MFLPPRIAFLVPVLAVLSLAGCAGSPAADPCAAAVEHIAMCLDGELPPPSTCASPEAAQAALDLSCEDLRDLGKADGGLGCSWIGRALGLCVAIPDDAHVLSTIGTPADELLGDKVRILVWNVHKGEEEEWDEEMTRLTSDVDLVLTQEILLDQDSRETLEASDRLQYIAAATFLVGGSGGPATGVATGSSAEAVDVQFVRSSRTEPILNTPKMMLLTTYTLIDGRLLLVANVHGINFVTDSAFREQMLQLEEAISTHEGPMLVAGDFNTWTSGRREALDGAMTRQGLVHAALADDHRWRVFDHVYSRELTISSARLLNDLEASDHAPILIEAGLSSVRQSM